MATTVMTESRTIQTVSSENRKWATMLFATTSSVPLLILRLGLGIVFLPHGLQKTFGLFGGHGFSATMNMFTQQMGIPAFFAVLAIAAEMLGSLGLITGFLTRIAAFGILCNMVVAALFVHLPNGFFMNWEGMKGGEGFEYHILAIVIALSVVIAGAGRYSIDRSIFRKLIGRS